MKKISGWHFSTGRLNFGDGRTIVAGETYTQTYPDRGWDQPKLCESGMHASVRILHALSYAPGLIVSRVTLSGKIVLSSDKMVAESRRHEWLVDASEIVIAWAFWCANHMIHLAAPAGLRAAGLVAAAEELEKLPEIIDRETAKAAAVLAQGFWANNVSEGNLLWGVSAAAEVAWRAADATTVSGASRAWEVVRVARAATAYMGGTLLEDKLVEMVENAR